MVRSRYAHGTLTVGSWYAHGTPKVLSRYAQGTLTVRSRYAHGQSTVTKILQSIFSLEVTHTSGKDHVRAGVIRKKV